MKHHSSDVECTIVLLISRNHYVKVYVGILYNKIIGILQMSHLQSVWNGLKKIYKPFQMGEMFEKSIFYFSKQFLKMSSPK